MSRKGKGIKVIALFLGALLLTSFCPEPFLVFEKSLAMSGWRPEHANLKFLIISDLHLRAETIGDLKYSRMVSVVNQLQPDFIFLLGDTFGREQYNKVHEINDVFVKLVSQMKATHGIYAIMGNHELFCGYYAPRAALENAGVKILEDQLEVRHINGYPLLIYGLMERSWKELATPPNVLNTLRGLPAPLILSHRPDAFQEMPPEKPFLMLSGHTHGGLFRAPFFNGGVFRFNNEDVYARYTYGHFKETAKQLLVTSGMGDSSYYTRLNVPYEMILLTIKPEVSAPAR